MLSWPQFGSCLSETEPVHVPMWRKAVNFICGVEEKKPEATQKELDREMLQMISIEEKSFWRNFWNINAVLLMTVAIFFWVFYA